MTLMIQTQSPVAVSCWKLTEDTLHLAVGTMSTALDKEQAAKLAAYLEAFIGAKVS